ncbi:seipin-2 [Lactuca sativa]|uniref:Seipin n=1 Tax=Lactuca sativa TaxID=4236 RepID=A0A9R1VW09_LACSA|nr:seipin-2 [Lactuca sativa]KAJ0211661.1 hypothetical protein LSAT_V11C400175990 [Lactuca sativa]
MEQENTKSTINNNIEDADTQFCEESLFVDSWDNFESDNPLFIAKSSSISDLNNINVASPIQSKETPSSSTSADLNHTQLDDSQQSLKEISSFYSFNKPDSLGDLNSHDSATSPRNDCKISSSTKDNEKSKTKSKSTRFRSSSSSHLKSLNEDTTSGYSAITSVSDDDQRIDDESITANSPVSGSNFLYSLAGLVIKMIGFQLNLLVTSVTFPISLIYYSYLFVLDPFRITSRAKYYILGNISKIFSLCCNSFKSTIITWIKKHESTWKLCGRFGWGFFWSVYVGFILISLLVFAFLVSGITLKCIMEEPIQITQELHFDYTKDSPMAFVPLMSCPDSSFLECTDLIEPGCSDESRVIPLYHKVHATLSLTLPESYYNRDLGIFQVRIDFLSKNGNRLASTRQPCMLQFKSQPIRLILTFLNLAPLITGYSSESQTLKIKFRGYTEGNDPTSCLRVILEQRAEFTRGAGVPEIYEASLKLESQPPFFKRILWYWKGTIYVWVSIVMFVVELFILLCCTPVIAPWTRGVSVNNYSSRNTRVSPK